MVYQLSHRFTLITIVMEVIAGWGERLLTISTTITLHQDGNTALPLLISCGLCRVTLHTTIALQLGLIQGGVTDFTVGQRSFHSSILT